MQSSGPFFAALAYALLAAFGGPPTVPDPSLLATLLLLQKTENVQMDVVDRLIAARVSPKRLVDLAARAESDAREFHSVLYDEGVHIDWVAARRLQGVTVGIGRRVAEITDHPVYRDLSDSARWNLALLDYTPSGLMVMPYRFDNEEELIAYLKKHNVRLSRRDTALLVGYSYDRIH